MTFHSFTILLFEFTTFLTVYLFSRANQNTKPALTIIFIWMILQSILGMTNFYQVTTTTPPRFILLALPALLFIIGLFITNKGRSYIDSLNTKSLTILHIVRIPVEIVLYLLFMQKAVPEIMTFTGHNFDILAGLTAPAIYYFGFVKKQLHKNVLLLWNFVCLGLLLNIVVHAILSAQSPFQQLAFDQPNIAITYFPFVWLPSVVVPLVLFSHLATIRQLVRSK